jgi:hypothetical protein
MKLGKLASGNGGGLLHANSCSCGLEFDRASAAIRAWKKKAAAEGTSARKYVVVLLPKDRGRMDTRSMYIEREGRAWTCWSPRHGRAGVQGVDVLDRIENKEKKRLG